MTCYVYFGVPKCKDRKQNIFKLLQSLIRL
jgi:hypothetical protein